MNLSMPRHQSGPNNTFSETIANSFHEVNELYNGTLNQVHTFMYATKISSNESFTLHDAMKQEDQMQFIEAVEKEISEDEEGHH